MKTRQGFVSNSSTTAYFIVIPAETHKKILKSFYPKVQELLQPLTNKKTRLFQGKRVYLFTYIGYNEEGLHEEFLGKTATSLPERDAIDVWLEKVSDNPNVLYSRITDG